MVHNITKSSKTGKHEFAYVGEAGWHGLGQKLEAGASQEEWSEAAGFNWRAVKRPIYYLPGESDASEEEEGEANLENAELHDNAFVLLRDDTQKPLSIVSPRYNVVQPREVLEFFSELAEKVGGFTMETAGTLIGGKKVWALAKANSDHFSLGEDRVLRYLLMATSYDFSLPTIVSQTSIRAVCDNTLTAALASGTPRLAVSHISKFSFEGVRERMKLDEDWAAFTAAADSLASLSLAEADARRLYEDLFFPVKAGEERKELTQRQNTKIDEMVGIMRNSPGAELPSAKDTYWGWLNGLTYYVDHGTRAKSVDARVNAAQFGEGFNLKARALELVAARV